MIKKKISLNSKNKTKQKNNRDRHTSNMGLFAMRPQNLAQIRYFNGSILSLHIKSTAITSKMLSRWAAHLVLEHSQENFFFFDCHLMTSFNTMENIYNSPKKHLYFVRPNMQACESVIWWFWTTAFSDKVLSRCINITTIKPLQTQPPVVGLSNSRLFHIPTFHNKQSPLLIQQIFSLNQRLKQ